jgi:hypothetical protein
VKIIYLAIASLDPIHEIDRCAQSETWVKRISKEDSVYWLRGNPLEKAGINGDYLLVDVEEKYENILAKTLAGVAWLLENSEFDYLIRTNVSTYFEPRLVREALENIRSTSGFAGGYFEYSRDSYRNSTIGNRFISGASLVLDKIACQSLLGLNPSDYPSVPDDVAISNYLTEVGIPLNYMGRCNVGYSHLYFRHFATRVKSSKNSKLASARMFLIDSYFNQTSFIHKIFSITRIYFFEFKSISLSLLSFLDFSRRLYGLSKNYLKSNCGI